MTPVTFSVVMGLCLCNILWSLNPVMGKWLLEDFSAAHAAWLRYGTAWLAILPLLFWKKLPKLPTQSSHYFLFLLLGLLTFALTPMFQAQGLDASQATDNSLIIALEPLATVALACIFLGERLLRHHYISFFFGILGFTLLSQSDYAWGNLLLLLSIIGESGYSVITRKLLPHYKPVTVMGLGLTVGIVLLSFFVLYREGLPSLGNFHLKSLLALLWLGPIGTTLTYLYWTFILARKIPIAGIAVFLFIQPLLGLVWGHFMLGDYLSPINILGIALILMAIAWQVRFLKA